jgi:hypothetical protein
MGCADLGAPVENLDDPSSQGEQQLFVDKENLWEMGQNGTVCYLPEGGGPIQSALGDFCLDASSEAGRGNPISAVPCSEADEQRWTLGDDGTIRALSRCLNVSAAIDNQGPGVNLRYCNHTSAQQWKLRSGTHENQPGLMLVHVETGYCLHVLKDVSPPSGNVRLGTCVDSEDQHWSLPNTAISPEHQRAMHDAIVNSWTAVTELRLDNWGLCDADSDPATTVVIRSRRGEGEGTGRDDEGRRLVTMDLSPSSSQRDFRATIVHEFGHVLGFAHEQGRLENRYSEYCDSFQGGTWDNEINHPSDWSKTTTFGVFDPASVVSYCIHANAKMMLSRNDVLGAQHYYGKRNYRRVLWSTRSTRPIANRVLDEGSPLTLKPGERWGSRDRKVALVLEADGQLTVRRLDLSDFGPLWTSKVKAKSAHAEFGADGILRVVSKSATVWQSTTRSYPGATLEVRHDGNVVIEDADGEARWSTDTLHRDDLEGATGLIPGARLAAGEHKDTQSGRYRLEMQKEGNLVVRDRWRHDELIWSSDTAHLQAKTAKMMLDGTLALLDDSGTRVWTANFSGRAGAFLALQEDGNLVAYEPSKFLVWSAGEDSYDDTSGSEPFVSTFDAEPVMLWNGSTIGAGSAIVSASGRSKLTMEPDGNLALYVTPSPEVSSPKWTLKWDSKTRSATGGRAKLETNGALRVYSGFDRVLYESETSNYMNSYLSFNDSGRIMIYRVVTVGASGIGFTF